MADDLGREPSRADGGPFSRRRALERDTVTARSFCATPPAGPVDRIADALDSLSTRDRPDSADEDEATEPPGEETTRQEEALEEEEEAVDEPTQSPPRVSTTDWRPVVGRSTPPLERRADPLTGATIQQVRRRHEICRRHVQQLFVRGEQVALVAVLPA